MTEQTPNLQLPYIAAAQAQKHVTHNEAIRALDAIVQVGIRDRDLAQPPADPADGDRYLVASAASGAWAGQSGRIAAWQDGAWLFYVPRAGWLVWVEDEQSLLVWDGAGWIEAGGGAVNPAPLVGVNTTAGAPNRLAVKSDSVLLSHDDVTPGSGDIRIVTNKAAASNTASFLFQTAFSGRAEIGTTGDDKLALKVSANGASWSQPLTVDPATGNVGIWTTSPQARLDIATSLNNGVRLTNGATYSQLAHFTGGGDAGIFDYDVVPGNAAAPAEIRYFRNTNTTGLVGVRVLRGNGTAAANSFLAANTDTYLNAAVGNVGVGTAAPSTKLHVAGPVRVGSYTVAGLPAASVAGAGSIVYVSNEAGGATLCFSDGTTWRRAHDRAVVS